MKGHRNDNDMMDVTRIQLSYSEKGPQALCVLIKYKTAKSKVIGRRAFFVRSWTTKSAIVNYS